MDGVVLEAGPASGYGLAVYIQHENGDVTVYGHMDEILVAGRPGRPGRRHHRPARQPGPVDRPAPALRGARRRHRRSEDRPAALAARQGRRHLSRRSVHDAPCRNAPAGGVGVCGTLPQEDATGRGGGAWGTGTRTPRRPPRRGSAAASPSSWASRWPSWSPRSSAPPLTGSLALLADAGHMATDAAGIALALGAVTLAQRPPRRTAHLRLAAPGDPGRGGQRAAADRGGRLRARAGGPADREPAGGRLRPHARHRGHRPGRQPGGPRRPAPGADDVAQRARGLPGGPRRRPRLRGGRRRRPRHRRDGLDPRRHRRLPADRRASCCPGRGTSCGRRSTCSWRPRRAGWTWPRSGRTSSASTASSGCTTCTPGRSPPGCRCSRRTSSSPTRRSTPGTAAGCSTRSASASGSTSTWRTARSSSRAGAHAGHESPVHD